MKGEVFINIKTSFKNINVLLLIKAGLGSAIAIFLADQFNLLYSASAGIITLLTIQNTKKETISIAFKRIVAFIIAVMLALLIFKNLGYTVLAFGVFIFLFTAICNLLAIEVGIIMNAVLISHFLIEKNMGMDLILNEALILIIGMSIGIVVNSIMPSNIKKIKAEQIIVEDGIRNSLNCIAEILSGGLSSVAVKNQYILDFDRLDSLIDDLLVKAYEDAGNTFLSETRYQISYLEMRSLQVKILRDIFDSVKGIQSVFPQAIKVSNYISKVSKEFHELNNVKQLQAELADLYEFFRSAHLPTTRDEFENRAILYSILRDIDNFLQVKRSFVEQV